MGICWYCYWGWPKQVADIYARYGKQVGFMAMHYGPGHVVWEDENWDSDTVQWCIDNAQKYRHDLRDDQLSVVVESLKELLAIPDEMRCCEPKDYEEENPAQYPPPNGLQMVDPRKVRKDLQG